MIFPHDIASAVTPNEGAKLADLAAGQLVLELGAHFGRSTVVLASVAAQVHSVDWHLGDPHAGHGDSLGIYISNLRRYGVIEKVVTHVGRFEDVLPAFHPGLFDGCFLDGQHDAESVERDLRLLDPLVFPGGWLAFHDYGSPNPLFGVRQVVDAYASARGLHVEQYDSLAVIRKEDA